MSIGMAHSEFAGFLQLPCREICVLLSSSAQSAVAEADSLPLLFCTVQRSCQPAQLVKTEKMDHLICRNFVL